jgi:hypothetical protein
VRQLRTELDRWLDGLDADAMLAEMSEPGYRYNPQAHSCLWQDQGWQIRFVPIPFGPDLRGSPDIPSIGISHPTGRFELDNTGTLLDGLNEKANRYGMLGMPYVIAVANESMTPHDGDIRAALVSFCSDAQTDRHISAVLTVKYLRHSAVSRHVPTLWHNPSAEHPLHIECAPWIHTTNVETGRWSYTDPDIQPSDFFGL